MKKKLVLIIIGFALFFQAKANILSFVETNFYIPYLITAQAYYDQGKYDSSLLYYSIPYGISTGNWLQDDDSLGLNIKNLYIKRSLWVLTNLRLGQIYYYLGNYTLSEMYMQAMGDSINNLRQSVLDLELNYYLGLLYCKTYNYEKSLLSFFKSLNLYKKEFGDSSYYVGVVLCDIGSVYYNQLDYDKSLEYYLASKKVLSLQGVKSFSKLSLIANNIGSIYYRLGDLQKAVIYYDEAIIMQEKATPDYYNLSMYYNNIGGIYLTLSNYGQSEKYYKKSLTLRLKHTNNRLLHAQSYNQLAVLYLSMESYQLSLSYIQKAIDVNSLNNSFSQYSQNPMSDEVLDYWLYGISLYFKTIILNNLSLNSISDTTIIQKEHSLSTLKTLLSHFDYVYAHHVSESNYFQFLEFNREVINMAIDLFYRSGNLSKYQAFDLMERGRSIVLFQSMIESKAKNFVGIPQELLEEERSQKQKINQCELDIRIAQKANIDINNSSKFYELILKKNKELKSLDSLKAIYQKKFPKYYNLKYNYSGPPVWQIQSKIPDSSAIIEYYLSDSILYTAVIAKNCFKIYSQNKFDLIQAIEDHSRNIKFNDMGQVKVSGELLFKLLLAPLKNKLKDINTLIIIPDAELSLLPFETIISSDYGENMRPRYILYDYNISYHFSSALWLQSKDDTGVAFQSFTKQEAFLGYAPVFEGSHYSKKCSITGISPLPFTKVELETIEEKYEENDIKTRTFFQQNATKESFIRECGKYKIIHLATHGIYNDGFPELSGIAFIKDTCYQNRNYFSQQLSGIDLLYVNDTYNLPINADLVVISACMSGLGKMILGEGYMTLYRGFFYAGAKNILFSLWNVSDKASSLFMITFYGYILSGQSYTSALQLTKLHFLENEKTILPVYWSGFLLLGG